MDDPGSREARRPQARRPRGGINRRQYRHRACGGGKRARLSHADPDSRDAKPGKEGHAAAVRRRARRSPRSCPIPIRTTISMSAAGSPISCARPSPTACCSPTNGTISTMPKRISNRRVRKSGSRPAARSTASSARSVPPARIAGTTAFLKSKNKDIVTACADPPGFAMYDLFKTRRSQIDIRRLHHRRHRAWPRHAGREDAKVDDAFLIPDEESVSVIYDLFSTKGLCLGGSTGVNVAGAIRLAKQLGPGKTIVTILADSGNRYQSKLFNPDFMRSKNLPVPDGWRSAARSSRRSRRCEGGAVIGWAKARLRRAHHLSRDAVGRARCALPTYAAANAAKSG